MGKYAPWGYVGVNIPLDALRRIALPLEVDAIKSYLLAGMDLAQGKAFSPACGPAIMALWAAGIEHLLKVTIAAPSGFDARTLKDIPNKKRHDIEFLWQETAHVMAAHPSVAKGHIRAALDEVHTDPVLEPLLAALGRYAMMGRYHMLDLIDGGSRDGETPSQLWDNVRITVGEDSAVREAMRAAGRANWTGPEMGHWDAVQGQRLNLTVSRLWWLLADALRNGTFGAAGRQAGVELLPPRARPTPRLAGDPLGY